ncbi:uncharacterized protein YbjQ (UPF0145 family) [Enterococcus sp. PF1-24]|uniref:heavy metal-binding domain-containing protein n=1 Tax=unclassified Enterococcus TaxID=2608891 RepID=UPI0024765B47|nr:MULTISPECIES: heavy metal-binding domain-containing protein [unclassified Enterococcus]MDH6364359.1 uncharacterized protein YbjQ (UPF0145 family) [Enterococcus sp. PFB1-1]MDH6401452.1 uncharacterized protein YbjQ (UPF0145 family) [Enterococcus sp. PF1-24]
MNETQIKEVVLSTGNVNRKYLVRDLIFATDQINVDLFAEENQLNDLLAPIKHQLKMKALEYGGDAVINCHFDYQQHGTITNIFAYGTVVQFTQTTIG